MVSGRSALTRVICHLPTHLLLALEPQKFALAPWPLRLDHGRRPSPNPANAGRRAGEICPWSLAAAPRSRLSYIPQPTYCWPLRRRSLPLVPGRRASTRVFVHLPADPLASSGPAQKPKEEAAYRFEYRGPRPDCRPELWSRTDAHRPAPCGPRKRPQPLTVVRQPPKDGPRPEWPPRDTMEAAQMKIGFRLALGQTRWHARPSITGGWHGTWQHVPWMSSIPMDLQQCAP